MSASRAITFSAGFSGSHVLSARQKTALRFTDAFLANEAGTVSLLGGDPSGDGFTDEEAFEIAVGLGLFHGFSKVLICLGVEPEPATMEVTELATPDTADPCTDLRLGLDRLSNACDAALGAQPELLAAARIRVRQLLGVEEGSRANPHPFLDLVELYVIDVHAITDQVFASATVDLEPAEVTTLLVALAHADATARLERSGALTASAP